MENDLGTWLVSPHRDPFTLWTPAAAEAFNAQEHQDGRVVVADGGILWQASDEDVTAGASEDPTTIALLQQRDARCVLHYDGLTLPYPPWGPPFWPRRGPWYPWYVDVSLEYVAYFLDHGGAGRCLLGESSFSPAGLVEFRAPRAAVSATLVVGRVVRRLVARKHFDVFDRSDPIFETRRAEQLEDPSLRTLATACPNLSEQVPSARSDRVLVFVHGTASSCLTHLDALARFSGKLYRFEHDTYRPLTENARDLFSEVQRVLPDAGVVLVGHSRGGLVARSAASLLAVVPRPIDLVTLGTPHLGTTLITLGRYVHTGYARRALARSCWRSIALGARSSGTSQDQLVSELLSHRDLPRGWIEMETGARTLSEIRASAPPSSFRAVGSEYEWKANGLTLQQRFLARYLDSPHDLVVTYESATGDGLEALTGQLRCGHGDYFHEPDVEGLLQSLVP